MRKPRSYQLVIWGVALPSVFRSGARSIETFSESSSGKESDETPKVSNAQSSSTPESKHNAPARERVIEPGTTSVCLSLVVTPDVYKA